jgi:hypothetical protein
VLACFHVVVKRYRYSLEERVFIVKTYLITDSIKNCQRRFVEQFCGRNPPSKRCNQLLVKKLILSFRVANFLYVNSQNTQPHFITGMTCKYCTLVLFVNQHFPGLPASGTHCIKQCRKLDISGHHEAPFSSKKCHNVGNMVSCYVVSGS